MQPHPAPRKHGLSSQLYCPLQKRPNGKYPPVTFLQRGLGQLNRFTSWSSRAGKLQNGHLEPKRRCHQCRVPKVSLLQGDSHSSVVVNKAANQMAVTRMCWLLPFLLIFLQSLIVKTFYAQHCFWPCNLEDQHRAGKQVLREMSLLNFNLLLVKGRPTWIQRDLERQKPECTIQLWKLPTSQWAYI